MTTMAEAPDKVTYEEAARLFGRSPATIRSWVGRGYLRKYKRPLDKRAYVSVAEIDALLHTAEAVPDDSEEWEGGDA